MARLRTWPRRLRRLAERPLTRRMERRLLESDMLDEATVDSVRRDLLARGDPPADPPDYDARRIAFAIEYVRRYGLTRGTVVEIGSLHHAAAELLWDAFPDARPQAATNDFRKEPLPFADGSVTSLVCLEVLEHLSDVDYAHATTLSGVFYFLDEVYRVLEVGGRALISTPNAASLAAIRNAMRHEPPMQYRWHFREFTVDELRRILEHAGFSILTIRAEFVWQPWGLGRLGRQLAREGHRLDDRGDDVFAVVEKPRQRDRRPHGLDLPTGR